MAECTAFHFDGGTAEAVVQAIACGFAIDELVAAEDRTERDQRWFAGSACGSAEWREGKAFEALADGVDEFWLDVVAQPIGGVEEGDVARLIGLDGAVLVAACVMLESTVGNDHVANVEFGVEAASDTGEDDHASVEAGCEERCSDGSIDLADPGADQNDVGAVKLAVEEVEPADDGRGLVLEGGFEVVEFLGNRAHEADGHHGSPLLTRGIIGWGGVGRWFRCVGFPDFRLRRAS